MTFRVLSSLTISQHYPSGSQLRISMHVGSQHPDQRLGAARVDVFSKEKASVNLYARS